MGRVPGDPSPILSAVYRTLLAVLAALAVAILAGTAIGLASGGKPAPAPAGAAQESPEASPAYFTGIGRIRAATAGERPATVVVSIAFPYDRNDRAFQEELAAKTKSFRDIAADYFSALSSAQLREMPETEIKKTLMARFNSVLVLGKIEALFFNDYLVID
jgi:flagellar basal body-associated protein FliL